MFEFTEDMSSFRLSEKVDSLTKQGKLSVNWGNLTNIKIQKTIKLDKQNKHYQYGRVPFRVQIAYGPTADRMEAYGQGYPKLFIIDDMDYQLPPKQYVFPNWARNLLILIGVA